MRKNKRKQKKNYKKITKGKNGKLKKWEKTKIYANFFMEKKKKNKSRKKGEKRKNKRKEKKRIRKV